MESVDIMISEEAQQDVDLKSAFAPAVPRQPFFRAIAEDLKGHRALLLKAGLRADHKWYMPHEIPTILCDLIKSSSEFPLEVLHQDAQAVRHSLLGKRWLTSEENPSSTALGASLQAAHTDPRRVIMNVPEGFLVSLGYAITRPGHSFQFHQAESAAARWCGPMECHAPHERASRAGSLRAAPWHTISNAVRP